MASIACFRMASSPYRRQDVQELGTHTSTKAVCFLSHLDWKFGSVLSERLVMKD